MSDRIDSTAAGTPADTPETPTSWEERPAFREAFLFHFPPLAAESLRQAGRHLYDAVLEHELREPAEPWVRGQVRALAADLRFTAQVLATVSRQPVESGLDYAELALAVKAETWAAEVVAVCLGIEGALERESGS